MDKIIHILIPRCFGLMDTDVRRWRCKSRSTLWKCCFSWNDSIQDRTNIQHFAMKMAAVKIYSLWDQTNRPEDTFLGYGTEYTKRTNRRSNLKNVRLLLENEDESDMVLFSRFNCWK